MFAIGQAKSKVNNGKIAMPKEYRLKYRKVMGKWKDESILYISDSENSLHSAAGRSGDIFMVTIDSEDKLQIPMLHEQEVVNIRGCVSTIELIFTKH